MKKTFYITTPIYYPSGKLHIGHLYTTTMAWAIANYKKLDGYDTKFLTGSDEHGQKIEQKANEANKSPQEYVDEMAVLFKELWTKLDIEYDYFSRTTSKNHEEIVSKIFTKFLDEGFVYKGKYKGLYSVSDEEFFTKTQAVEKDGKFYSPVSDHELVEVEEDAYFFKMSEQTEWLKKYINDNPDFISSKKTITELMNNFLNVGLEDLSVTRNTFKWGVPVKEDPSHILYVWIDALSNYITALGYNTENDQDFKTYWENGTEVVHVVGKEITRFHCIYWPIMLNSLGIKQPTTILSHGWIVTDTGDKMSKSKGNSVEPEFLIETYGAEVVKYFFVSQTQINHDYRFNSDQIKNVYNADLVNNFGNLLSRTVAMISQNFDTPVVHVDPTTQDDIDILESITKYTKEYKDNFDKFFTDKAFRAAMKLSKALNGYIDVTMPWTLKEDKVRLSEVLNNLLNGIYAVTTMLSVVIPNKAQEALDGLQLAELSLDNIEKLDKFDKVIYDKKIPPLFERFK